MRSGRRVLLHVLALLAACYGGYMPHFMHRPRQTRGGALATVAIRCAMPDRDLPAALPSATTEAGLGGAMRDLRGLWGQLVGKDDDARGEQLQRELEPSATEDLEFVPLVLVIGATGRTGRIITRKLVLQGFRVAVLVRSLSTETLNLLGSGTTGPSTHTEAYSAGACISVL